ncbi:ribosome biogenesis protein Nop16 [Xylariaceae sp. FL1019]|nr:ribosome biogenesis protein Nop16 [Xylariaceae sp. FL1019]
MGRELQKRKRRSSRPATRQPSSTRAKLTNPLGNNIVAKNWNKKETTTQNYRRLGLVNRLRAPTGGVEPISKRSKTSSSNTSTSTKPTDPFALTLVSGPLTSETRVERDASGKILRVISSSKPPKANPLHDPLLHLDTDSDASSSEEAEEWDGFEGERSEVVKQLETDANRPIEKKPRVASSREVEWLESLVAKHGNDVKAMSKDRKLNPMQQTEGDISRRLKRCRGE